MLLFTGCLFLWGAFTRDTSNHSVLFMCAILADFYTTGMTVVLMGFALELLLHYESVTTQLARSTPTS